jgi:diacylglycerol kinase family enzyme
MQGNNQVEVILNAHAGFQNHNEARDRLQELFEHHGLDAKITISHSGKEIHQLAKAAAEGSNSTIVVGGGDGTISAFASALIKSEHQKVLGVLPLGTLNHFAQDLQIPLTLEDAVAVIAAAHQTTIDVAEVNGRIFINNSSLGLYPQIVRERVKQQHLGHGKWPAFMWAAISVFRRYPFVDVRLVGAGKRLDCRTPFVFIGNNEYLMEGFNIGRRAKLDGGTLSLYVTRRLGRWGLIRLALRAFLGHARDEKDFEAITTTQVKIDSRRRRLRVAFDGEIDILETPLHYRVLPGALRVIVPAKPSEK